jgi:hypothetical protein
LIGVWNVYGDGLQAKGSLSFDSALLDTIRQLNAAGVHPWLLLEVPTYTFDIPKALVRSIRLRERIDSRCTTNLDLWDGFAGKGAVFRSSIEAVGGRVIDPRPSFIDPTGRSYLVSKDGLSLYRDSGHLTAKGASLLLPLLRDILSDDLGS